MAQRGKPFPTYVGERPPLGAPADDDEIVWRDASNNATVRETWASLRSRLNDQYAPLASPTFTGNVVVPAATAATHAAQVTAMDATTGRLAIGGREIGDTGWRQASDFLTAAWEPVSANETFVAIRRTGDLVHIRLIIENVSGVTQTVGAQVLVLPSGWAPEGFSQAAQATDGGGNGLTTAFNGRWDLMISVADAGVVNVAATYPVSSAWPTTLPPAAL
jgi:hypothetical protein